MIANDVMTPGSSAGDIIVSVTPKADLPSNRILAEIDSLTNIRDWHNLLSLWPPGDKARLGAHW